MKRHARSLLLLVPLGASLAGMASCSAPSKGGLVLAISTDMQAPKDINVVSVFITSDSVVKFDYLGQVLPTGTVALPATLAVIEPDDPNTQIRIRVTAFQNQTARVLRDVVTTVPHERTSLLRLPLNLLDDGDVTGTLPAQYVPDTTVDGVTVPDGDTTYSPIDEPGAILQPTCDFTQNLTSINGQCVPNTVDSSQLPDYEQAAVYGDGGIQPNGEPVSCFDAQTCFGNATAVQGLSMTQCTFPLPPNTDPTMFNVALVTQSTGLCISPGKCFVPLANDPNEGYSIANNTVHLVGGVCVKMMQTGAQLYQSTGACGTRTLSAPVCQPAADGQGGTSPTNEDDAAADASPAEDSSVASDASFGGGGGSSGGVSSDGSVGGEDAGPIRTDGGTTTNPCAAGQTYCNGTCVLGTTCGGKDGGSPLREAGAGGLLDGGG